MIISIQQNAYVMETLSTTPVNRMNLRYDLKTGDKLARSARGNLCVSN